MFKTTLPIILSALFSSTLAAFSLGSTLFYEVEIAYQNGCYENFIKANSEAVLREIPFLPQGLLSELIQSKEMQEQLALISEHQAIKIETTKTYITRLLALFEGYENEPIAMLIRELAANYHPAPLPEDFCHLENWNDDLERYLTVIEDWMRKRSAAYILAYKEKETPQDDPALDKEQLEKELLALKFAMMEELTRLLPEVSQPVSNLIEQIVQHFAQSCIYLHDLDELKNLAHGKTSPQTALEKKIAEVMRDYCKEMSRLNRALCARFPGCPLS